MTDAEVRALVTDAFKSVPRPDHLTDHTHCDECREHDEVLRGRDLDSLVISDVDSQAWNPITMATPQGFAYYLPALDRLALEPMPQGWDWYGYTSSLNCAGMDRIMSAGSTARLGNAKS